jgi:hypothetical protein
VDCVDALLQALEARQQLARRLVTDDLDRLSRCPGWSVRDVLGHSVGVTVKFTEFASGGTDRLVTPGSDPLGAELDPGLSASAEPQVLAFVGRPAGLHRLEAPDQEGGAGFRNCSTAEAIPWARTD